MKKLISLFLIAALLLSMCAVTAFAADGDQPKPTVGPAAGVHMFGGARCGIYDTKTNKSNFVVYYDYDQGGVTFDNEAVPGVTYDKASNTLTLKDVKQPGNELNIWYMGNDFKLNIEGTCELGVIYVYNYYNFHSTSLNIVGTGKLTVNEQLINDEAIHMFADGNTPLMGLDIADSVTVYLYSRTPEGEDEYAPVISLNATAASPEQGGAITVGGKALDLAQSERIKVTQPDYVNVVSIDYPDKENSRGMQVIRKSDPEGKYAATLLDGVVYVVSRYIYADSIRRWVVDDTFSYVHYSKDEFAAEFEFVYGMAPAPISYLGDYLHRFRGTQGVTMRKDGEPEAVYIGEPTGALWDWDDDYAGNYEIHRVSYDVRQEMYVEDASFAPIDLMADELEDNGYHYVTETYDQLQKLLVWDSPDPDDNRYEITCTVMKRASDPDGLYVQTGDYTDSHGEEGISVHKVFTNPENGELYYTYEGYNTYYFYITYSELYSEDCDFSYVYETVTENVRARFLPADYNIENDLTDGAIELKKKSEPGAVYAYRSWTHYYEDDTELQEYGLMRLEYSENLGCYLEDDSFDEIEFYDLSYLENNGYEVVMSEQPLTFYTTGSVYFEQLPVYTDNDGNTYYTDYLNKVYRYTDEDLITIGSKQYYYGVPVDDLSVSDLNSTEHEIVTDKYKYWVDGPKFKHIAGAQPQPKAYDLWVNGEQITSDHLTVTCGKGTATFSPSKNVLRLNNAEITKGTEKDWTYSGILSQLDELTVVVEGDCTITETNGDGIGTYNSESYQVGDVIYPAPYDLDICGDGTLTITESNPVYGYGFYCTGNLMIQGVTVNITSGASGIWASGLSISNAEANVHCTSHYSGIVVNRGSFDYENSTVTAVSDEGAGLLLGSDTECSTLTVNSGSLSLAGKLGVQGIVDYSAVAVNGGTLSVEGEEAAFDASFLADGAKNIIMGEGIGVISGALDGKSVVIGEASSDGFTVSGSITSYLEKDGVVSIKLTGKDNNFTADVTAIDAYSIGSVPAGEYVLSVSKLNHVTRDYEITVSGDTEQDVKICPLGDISGDGKVTTKDYAMANAHAQKVTYQTGYALKCGDVLKGDGKITTADAARINAAAQKINPLW